MLPVQVSPSPVYLGRQVHVTLSTLLVQLLASALQPPLFVAHLSIAVTSHYYQLAKYAFWKIMHRECIYVITFCRIVELGQFQLTRNAKLIQVAEDVV